MLLAPAVLPDRQRLVGLLVAVDDHERDLFDLGVSDPLADGVVGVVHLDPVRRELATPAHAAASRCCFADREHPDLHRSEPERERAGVVLDQDADEALERAEQRPVDDVGVVLVVVGAHVGEPEPLRHLSVELDRSHLPRAPERVGHVQIDLRPVEGAVALVD